jgi:hypothetical protein
MSDREPLCSALSHGDRRPNGTLCAVLIRFITDESVSTTIMVVQRRGSELCPGIAVGLQTTTRVLSAVQKKHWLDLVTLGAVWNPAANCMSCLDVFGRV